MMPDKSEASDNATDQPLDDKVVGDGVVADQGGTGGDSATADTEAASDFSSVDVAVDAGREPASAGNGEPLEMEESPGFGEQGAGDHEPDADDEIEQLRRQLTEAESRASENWDRLVRLQAEMENQRKRAQNDVNKARKFALEGIVGDLLPVKDSLEMGLTAARIEGADPQALIEGVQLTLKQLAQVFEKNNIIELNPVDEKFDPEFHQAMSMQEVEGKPANTVTSVMQKGYTLNDRLVRPALVMVAK